MPYWIHATIRYVLADTIVQRLCYHHGITLYLHRCILSMQACDTVDNIDQEVYLQMSQAAAYTLNVRNNYRTWRLAVES